MSKIGMIGPSYTAKSNAIADEECINWYPEPIETPGAQTRMSYIGTPGLAIFTTFDDGPTRGSCNTGSRVFEASGQSLYEVLADGTNIKRMDSVFDSFGAPVSIAFSTIELLIVAGGRAYCYELATDTYIDVTGMLAGAPLNVKYSDGYFIVMFAGSNKFQISGILDGTTWPGLQVNEVSVFAENIVSIEVSHRELWVQGSQHIQPYQDTGSDEVFDVIPGALIETGAVSTFGVDVLDNTPFWISEDNRGGRQAWRGNGYTPQRISTHAVETLLTSYSADQVRNLVTYSYQDSGHLFWVLYVPSTDCTWVYDVSSGLWHKRAEWDATNAVYGPHPSWNHVWAFGKHLVGDWASGNLYEMSLDQLQDEVAIVTNPAQTSILLSNSNFGALRTIDNAGIISTAAYTSTDALWIANGGFEGVYGLIRASDGSVYAADFIGSVVWKIAPDGVTVTRVAGTGTSGYSGDGGSALSAKLWQPAGLCLDAQENLYISDVGPNATLNAQVVRVVNMQSGPITVFGQTVAAGNIQTIAGQSTGGFSGDTGPATSALLSAPYMVQIDSSGVLWICDQENNRIRTVDSGGTINTVIGNGTGGFGGDAGAYTSSSVEIWQPSDIKFDSRGVLYITDGFHNERIRAANTSAGSLNVNGVTIAAGNIDTIAGNGSVGFAGDGGPALSAEFRSPWQTTPDGNGGLYICDSGSVGGMNPSNFRVRFVTASGVISTVAGIGGNPPNGLNTGDGGPAAAAGLGYVTGLIVISTPGGTTTTVNLIRRLRRSPTLIDEMEWIYQWEFNADFATGLGPQPPLQDGSGNPRAPQAMLRWSDNRGSTWSNQHIVDCGFAGEYNTRVIWRRLGRSRYRVYELSVSDPIPWYLVDAYLRTA